MLAYWETLMKHSIPEEQIQLLAGWIRQAETNGVIYTDLLALASRLAELGYSNLALYLYQGLYPIETDAAIARQVSRLYTDLQHINQALEWAQAISIQDCTPEDQRHLAQLLIQDGQSTLGLKILQELVHDSFTYAPGYFALADYYLNQGNIQQARNLAEAVFTYFEDDESREQARKYLVMTYLEDELIPYHEILKLYQGKNSDLKMDSEDYYLQAHLYQQLGDYDRVIRVAQAGLQEDEDVLALHLLLMEAYSLNAQVAKLADEIQWFIDHVPSDDEAVLQVAQYANNHQLMTPALLDRLSGFLPYILDLDVGYESLNLVVDSYLDIGEPKKAQTAIDEASLMFTENELAYFIGRVKEAEGLIDEAISYYQLAADQLIGPTDLSDYIQHLKETLRGGRNNE